MPTNEVNSIRIESATLGLLARYGITEPGFDIEDIAEAEGVQIRRRSLTNADAWLVRGASQKGLICLNDSIPETGRIRFTIAHELGHWNLHPNLSQWFLCTATDFTDYSRSREEAEANIFAANLLMPRQWLGSENWRADPSFEVISNMARDFQTTLTAASRRFVELSKNGVVLVFSRDGRIQWVVKSTSAKKMYFDGELPAHSLTRECLASGNKPASPEQVDPKDWLPTWNFSGDSEMFEDVRISPKYGWALTLLWLPELG